MSELLDFLSIAERAVEAAFAVIRVEADREWSVKGKGDRDFATDVDFAVEDEVRRRLAERTPEIPLLGEERGRSGGSDSRFEWVLDPIDGTVNFAHGSPLHCVSLALTDRGDPVVGVVAAPRADEWFTAAAGHGARLNGRRLVFDGPVDLAEAVVSLGDFATGTEASTRNEERFALLSRLVPRVQRIRMIGSAALDLCWVASGRLDATLHDRIHLWDVAAGIVVAREAGAVVADWEGGAFGSGPNSIAACSAGLLPDLVDLLRD
ncbi:inositol monophosphatase family protein [Glycomyces halotolerans]